MACPGGRGCSNAALAANDRIKSALALLQMAAAHADEPDRLVADLKHERIACGIADRTFDTVAETASRKGTLLRARLLDRIAADISRWRRRSSSFELVGMIWRSIRGSH